jgi:TPR repeat protein
MLNLGAMYFAGRGLPQDYVEALKWRSLAAAYASTDEQKTFIDARDAVAKVMTPEQVAEAKKRANEWVAAFEKRQK